MRLRWKTIVLPSVAAIFLGVCLAASQTTTDLGTLLDAMKAFILASQQQAALMRQRLDAHDLNFQNLTARLTADEADIAALKTQVGTLSASATNIVKVSGVSPPSASLSPLAGHRLLVECNGNTGWTPGIADSQGTAYAQIGNTIASASSVQAVWLSASLSGGALTVSCPLANEIYPVELTGATSVSVAQATGAVGPAIVQFSAEPRDLLIAFCVTWTCTPSPAWTSLSTYHNNLITARIPVLAGAQTAGFTVNHDWTVSVVSVR